MQQTHCPSDPVVLIVDDNAVDAMLLEHALQSTDSGTQVHWCSTGDAALSYLSQARKPDLLLLDFYLPGYTGLDLIREMEKSHQGSAFPTIIFSGIVPLEERLIREKHGVRCWVKPCVLDAWADVALRIEDMISVRRRALARGVAA